jgi:high-affinity K+ transport system ATPase subunit B
MLLAALSRKLLGFYDKLSDMMTSYLVAGAICVVVVIVACVTLVLVKLAWWILCIIAFFVVVAVFMGVVFSTAAYTASDGRRQARRDRQRERDSQDQEQRYRDYRPGKRDTTIYNVDEDDFTDENAPTDQKAYDFHDFE